MEYSSILLWKQHIILFWFLLCFCCCGMKNVNYFFLLFSDTLDTAAPIPQPLKIIGHNIDNLWSHINFHIIFIWCLLISNYKYSINPFLFPLFCMEEIRILIINFLITIFVYSSLGFIHYYLLPCIVNISYCVYCYICYCWINEN